MFKIDRKKAAEMLKVSVRTIDRYIQKGLLAKQIINGKIYVNDKDLKNIQISKGFQNEYNFSETSQATQASSTPVNSFSSYQPQNFSQNLETTEVYKKLFEELQDELKEKRRLLEGANYRVGQLEGLLKDSVPLLEHKKILTLVEKNETQITQKQEEINQLETKLAEEKLNKKIYLILLVILLALQPLWLFLPFQ